MENLITLLMLILLQAVLGFDNLLYISLESKNAPPEKQSKVRKTGISIAIALRIALLFLVINIIQRVQNPFLEIDIDKYVHAEFNIHSLIVLAGGVFILYTAMRGIWHMMHISSEENEEEDKKPKSARSVILWIVLMNLVFSFDSILSALALTKVFWIMATAIVISGILMMVLAERVSVFLERNRMYEVLGLFILFVVGIMLITEGGEIAKLELFGNEIVHMSKTTFYFVIGILIVTDIVQTRYQRKILQQAQKK